MKDLKMQILHLLEIKSTLDSLSLTIYSLL